MGQDLRRMSDHDDLTELSSQVSLMPALTLQLMHFPLGWAQQCLARTHALGHAEMLIRLL